jgi:hypothetical protein
VGSNSPKLSALTNSAFGVAAAANFPADSQSPHPAFNLAAFRSPGLLGTHGFNIGFREYNSPGFDFHNNGQHGGGGGNGSSGGGNSELNDDLRGSPSDNRNLDNSGYGYGYVNGHKKFESRLNGDKEAKRRDSRDNSPSNSAGKYYHLSSPVTSDDIVVRRPDDTDSPVGSSRSFSSQKNEDFDYHSSHNDSLGSHSPENLSSSHNNNNNNNNNSLSNNNNNNNNSGSLLVNGNSCSNNNNNNNSSSGSNKKVQPTSINDMLDHKLHLSFLGPPLAALHSMTEMKSQGSPQTATHNSQGGAPNPHGIDTILSRPPPVTSAQLNALAGGKF